MRNPCLFNRRSFVALLCGSSAVFAQDPTLYLTSDIDRVAARLACRCGACTNTVRDCAMFPHCGFCSEKRKQIHDMQQQGMNDDAIVGTFVKEDGIVALASPPTHGFLPIVTWLGPGIALLLGFGVYSWYIRRNRKQPAPLMPVDQAVLDRFKAQIDRELDDSPLKK
jgi:cytochrome c-type biogenesis protein CcmH/NrfF